MLVRHSVSVLILALVLVFSTFGFATLGFVVFVIAFFSMRGFTTFLVRVGFCFSFALFAPALLNSIHFLL